MTEEQERKTDVLKFTEELRAAGIAKVSVSYSGYGDEGRVEQLQFQGADGLPIDGDGVANIGIQALAELLAGFAPEGYENNDGGFGTVTFNVETGKIRREHNWWETVSQADEPLEL